jgi:hypothetical protein
LVRRIGGGARRLGSARRRPGGKEDGRGGGGGDDEREGEEDRVGGSAVARDGSALKAARPGTARMMVELAAAEDDGLDERNGEGRSRRRAAFDRAAGIGGSRE